MQIYGVQSFNQTTGTQAGSSNANGGRAQDASNPFSLAFSGRYGGSVDDNLNFGQNKNKNKNKVNQGNSNDQARNERIKQLQSLLESQQRELNKLQETLRDQLQSAPQGNGGLQADKAKGFQYSLEAKTNQIGKLQRQLSQEMANGIMGGFVGQQAGGSGISLSVEA